MSSNVLVLFAGYTPGMDTAADPALLSFPINGVKLDERVDVAAGHYLLDVQQANDLLSAWEEIAPYRGYIVPVPESGGDWYLATPGPATLLGQPRIVHEEWPSAETGVSLWSTGDFPLGLIAVILAPDTAQIITEETNEK